MRTLHDFPRAGIITAMDGKRLLARAQRRRRQGWLLKANGFEWTDWRAATPNCFGIVDRRFLMVGTKADAKRILKDILTVRET
jgi:hypothetical protein